jgi:hypothetical protein
MPAIPTTTNHQKAVGTATTSQTGNPWVSRAHRLPQMPRPDGVLEKPRQHGHPTPSGLAGTVSSLALLAAGDHGHL